MTLAIRDLSVSIGGHELVSIPSLDIATGERLALVGESGSGKTLTAMSIVGLQPDSARVVGSVSFQGRELLGRTESELARMRGSEIGVIFQDPLRALNPVMRVGRQIAEAIRLHERATRAALRARVLGLMEHVQLHQPERLVRRYPHQLSGGQRQRVLIAMAIACRPKLLIADEPTTALDVTVQRGILDLLLALSESEAMGLLFVSHDLGVVRTVSDRIAVMYGGRLCEVGPGKELLRHPRHRYTQALIAANPGVPDFAVEDPTRVPLPAIPGAVPAVTRFPSGCRFRDRCRHEIDACATDPELHPMGAGAVVACWNPAAEGEGR